MVYYPSVSYASEPHPLTPYWHLFRQEMEELEQGLLITILSGKVAVVILHYGRSTTLSEPITR